MRLQPGGTDVVSAWLDVPPGARTAIVDFEPGRLVPGAFKSLGLRIDGGQGQAALVVLDEDGHDARGRYERQ